MCRLRLATMPSFSHALSNRLTVCNVVPVISDMFSRVMGKSISIPSSTFLPLCCTIRNRAALTRCSTCRVDSSAMRLCISSSRTPTIRCTAVAKPG